MNLHSLIRFLPSERLRLLVILLVLFFSARLDAQHISLPLGGAYRPGCYVPLRIETDKAGLVQIRGENILSIDYPAAGAASVIVPLMCWQTSGEELEIQVNGQDCKLSVRPILRDEGLVVASKDATIPDNIFTDKTPVIVRADASILISATLKDSVDAIISSKGIEYQRPPISGPWTGMFSETVYEPANAWNPGRPQQQRYWILLAAIASLIGVAAIGLLQTRWVGIIAMGAGIGAATIFAIQPDINRNDSQMMILIDGLPISNSTKQIDLWSYNTARKSNTFQKSWPGLSDPMTLKLVPESPQHLKKISPILFTDASGQPSHISVQLGNNMRVAWLERYRISLDSNISVSDSTFAPSLWRQRLYGFNQP